jgi:hypothetical protein
MGGVGKSIDWGFGFFLTFSRPKFRQNLLKKISRNFPLKIKKIIIRQPQFRSSKIYVSEKRLFNLEFK